MHRRALLAAFGCCAALAAIAQDTTPRPHHKISAATLREALASRFPVRFAVPGVVELQVNAPHLVLRPSSQRIGATLPAMVSDLAARRAYSGEMDVVFGVRYRPSDRTLRAHDVEVAGVRSPGLLGQDAQAWRALLDDLARESVQDVVLYRFTPGDLALPDAMGFVPDTITVEGDGLLIGFAPR